MRKLLYFLPFHFFLFLILGICIQFYFRIWQFDFQTLAIIHLIFLLIFLFLNFRKSVTFLTFIYFFFVGISTVFVQNDANYSNYYERFLKDNSSVVLKVDKVLKSSAYHDKYQAIILQIDNQKTRGTVLLNLSKDTLRNQLKVNELLILKPVFLKVNAPLNPHQFNYQKYLEKQGIRQQIFLDKNEFKSLGLGSRTIKGWSEQFRDLVQVSMGKYHFKKNELAVINALLLGQRQDVSKQLLTDYARAGAIHILAVSGLHVGIILMLLLKLFTPFEHFKHGKTIKTIIIILILWMFAFVAGLSASVVRAVTMFSFLAIGQQFGSKKIILFSLFSSLFLLLIFNPFFLFDVGFQLSYLAVLGIITIQYKLYKIITFRNFLADKIWQLTTVSMAAQIGVLPLSLYYFHQFPGLFFLSNIVIIPFLGIVLMAGIVVIFLAIFQIAPQILADTYGFIISLMNGFVTWISNQEAFLFKDISLSFWLLLASYGIIFFGIRFLMDLNAKKAMYFLASCVIFQSIFLFEKAQKYQKNEWIVFHKTRQTVFGFRDKNKVEFLYNIDSIQSINSITNSYKIGENVQESFAKLNSNIYFYKNNPILIIDTLGIYHLNNLKNPIIVLQNSPKINLERMIKKVQPTQIIADGTNYKSYVIRWKKIALELKIPFHYSGEKGAFIKSD